MPQHKFLDKKEKKKKKKKADLYISNRFMRLKFFFLKELGPTFVLEKNKIKNNVS